MSEPLLLQLVLVHLAAFFIGAIPFGYFVARFKGVDIQQRGSGNTGATNVGRVLGKSAGVLTLVLDLAKGACATLLIFAVPHLAIGSYPEFAEFAAGPGFFAVLGHCFSPFLRFRGGKGVAAGLGVFLVLAPLPTACAALLFLLVLKTWRFVSVASVSAALSVPVFIWISGKTGISPAPAGPMLQLAAVCTALLIGVRHRSNLTRLAAGTEPPVNAPLRS